MLSFVEKFIIIQMLEKGESKYAVARKCGISWVAVHNINARRKQIKKYCDLSIRVIKRLPWLRILDLETALYQWYMRCTEKSIQLSASDILQKAEEFNENLSLDPDFKATYYWLQKFKERQGISCANEMKYLLTPTKAASNNFKANFTKFLQKNEIKLQNIYNANYTAIMWKAVPKDTPIFFRAEWTGDEDMCEDHVTVFFCVNATGCHKLPVLIIGNIAEPQSSSILNTDGIPTIYKVNASAWMDNIIFNQWFEEYFIKSVKERQEKKGYREKTVLLLDNNKLLLNLNDLNEKDEFVKVISFPHDVSPEIQPINDEVIACFKRMYRKELVITLMLLPVWNTEENVIQTHKKLTLKDSCRMVHDAWSYVDDAILKRGWDILFGYETSYDEFTDTLIKDIKETTAYLRTLSGCERCHEDFVFVWFKVENVHDIAMKVCTDEVLRSFGNIDIVNDEARPSYSKIPTELTLSEAQNEYNSEEFLVLRRVY